MPPAELMFKGERNGIIDRRLQQYRCKHWFPEWLTVTVAPKGSYCEEDILQFLKRHLEEWRKDRDVRILLVDDFSAHESQAVWNLAWSRGYVLLCHGGGATPVCQTPDTDLNQHVRRFYCARESQVLMQKMENGQTVPTLTHEECMRIMLEVWSDPE